MFCPFFLLYSSCIVHMHENPSLLFRQHTCTSHKCAHNKVFNTTLNTFLCPHVLKHYHTSYHTWNSFWCVLFFCHSFLLFHINLPKKTFRIDYLNKTEIRKTTKKNFGSVDIQGNLDPECQVKKKINKKARLQKGAILW